MSLLERAHVKDAVDMAISNGAVYIAEKAKIVQMRIKSEIFYIIANDKIPTFAFKTDLRSRLASVDLDDDYRESANHNLTVFDRSIPPKRGRQAYFVKPEDAVRALAVI